jgi:hypothetical protein
MSTMNMPGFTADRSLFSSASYYRGSGISRQTDGSIQPAGMFCYLSWEIRCDLTHCYRVRHCFHIPDLVQQFPPIIPQPGPEVPIGVFGPTVGGLASA